jgi:hypothetical protein
VSTRMTAAEYQEMIHNPKKSKMRNVKTVVDGIKFDSKLEADYYCQLKVLKRTGEVKFFNCQPRYLLQESFVKDGVKYKKMEYVADFFVAYADGHDEIVDCKGRKTAVYAMKKKLFEQRYPYLTITEVAR